MVACRFVRLNKTLKLYSKVIKANPQYTTTNVGYKYNMKHEKSLSESSGHKLQYVRSSSQRNTDFITVLIGLKIKTQTY